MDARKIDHSSEITSEERPASLYRSIGIAWLHPSYESLLSARKWKRFLGALEMTTVVVP